MNVLARCLLSGAGRDSWLMHLDYEMVRAASLRCDRYYGGDWSPSNRVTGRQMQEVNSSPSTGAQKASIGRTQRSARGF
jgi:hypothetical protein